MRFYMDQWDMNRDLYADPDYYKERAEKIMIDLIVFYGIEETAAERIRSRLFAALCAIDYHKGDPAELAAALASLLPEEQREQIRSHFQRILVHESPTQQATRSRQQQRRNKERAERQKRQRRAAELAERAAERAAGAAEAAENRMAAETLAELVSLAAEAAEAAESWQKIPAEETAEHKERREQRAAEHKEKSRRADRYLAAYMAETMAKESSV